MPAEFTAKGETARRGGAPFFTLKRRDALEAWLFMLPIFIGFLVFFLGPLIAVFYYSLTEWDLLSQESLFVGFANFRDALQVNPDFWPVLKNSFIFAAGLVPLNIALALALALALSKAFRGAIIFRTLFFAPVVTSGVAWAIVWKFLLQDESGAVNQALAMIAIDGPNWLREPDWAMVSVIFTRVLKMVGLNMILYIAALQSIPRDYVEAARIEGASSWQVFRMITLPLLTPVTLMISIVTMIGSFKVFDHIYLMTNGGPENGTLVLAFYIYQQGFEFFAIGYASALAVIMFIVILALTVLRVLVSSKDAR